MKITKKNHTQYGECAMCGYVGTIQFHHVIPKRYKVISDRKTRLYFERPDGSIQKVSNVIPIDKMMLMLCNRCHKKLHPENWMFHRNDQILEKRFKDG